MMREPNTDPIPAPDPATPTVAAPAPMNLAAESMSRDTAEVWNCLTAGRMLICWVWGVVVCENAEVEAMLLLIGLMAVMRAEATRADRAAGEAANLAKENILMCVVCLGYLIPYDKKLRSRKLQDRRRRSCVLKTEVVR
uniref:Uncharacterized protein n=1 Tax=Cacopsylla melanoneura TaxID=428564 RepID=A0A8D8WCE4_9HEMI